MSLHVEFLLQCCVEDKESWPMAAESGDKITPFDLRTTPVGRETDSGLAVVMLNAPPTAAITVPATASGRADEGKSAISVAAAESTPPTPATPITAAQPRRLVTTISDRRLLDASSVASRDNQPGPPITLDVETRSTRSGRVPSLR